jgi:hypothetical protein
MVWGVSGADEEDSGHRSCVRRLLGAKEDTGRRRWIPGGGGGSQAQRALGGGGTWPSTTAPVAWGAVVG